MVDACQWYRRPYTQYVLSAGWMWHAMWMLVSGTGITTLSVCFECRLDVPCTVDARHMPPSVAEVYVLAMTAALRRANEHK